MSTERSTLSRALKAVLITTVTGKSNAARARQSCRTLYEREGMSSPAHCILSVINYIFHQSILLIDINFRIFF